MMDNAENGIKCLIPCKNFRDLKSKIYFLDLNNRIDENICEEIISEDFIQEKYDLLIFLSDGFKFEKESLFKNWSEKIIEIPIYEDFKRFLLIIDFFITKNTNNPFSGIDINNFKALIRKHYDFSLNIENIIDNWYSEINKNGIILRQLFFKDSQDNSIPIEERKDFLFYGLIIPKIFGKIIINKFHKTLNSIVDFLKLNLQIKKIETFKNKLLPLQFEKLIEIKNDTVEISKYPTIERLLTLIARSNRNLILEELLTTFILEKKMADEEIYKNIRIFLEINGFLIVKKQDNEHEINKHSSINEINRKIDEIHSTIGQIEDDLKNKSENLFNKELYLRDSTVNFSKKLGEIEKIRKFLLELKENCNSNDIEVLNALYILNYRILEKSQSNKEEIFSEFTEKVASLKEFEEYYKKVTEEIRTIDIESIPGLLSKECQTLIGKIINRLKTLNRTDDGYIVILEDDLNEIKRIGKKAEDTKNVEEKIKKIEKILEIIENYFDDLEQNGFNRDFLKNSINNVRLQNNSNIENFIRNEQIPELDAFLNEKLKNIEITENDIKSILDMNKSIFNKISEKQIKDFLETIIRDYCQEDFPDWSNFTNLNQDLSAINQYIESILEKIKKLPNWKNIILNLINQYTSLDDLDLSKICVICEKLVKIQDILNLFNNLSNLVNTKNLKLIEGTKRFITNWLQSIQNINENFKQQIESDLNPSDILESNLFSKLEKSLDEKAEDLRRNHSLIRQTLGFFEKYSEKFNNILNKLNQDIKGPFKNSIIMDLNNCIFSKLDPAILFNINYNEIQKQIKDKCNQLDNLSKNILELNNKYLTFKNNPEIKKIINDLFRDKNLKKIENTLSKALTFLNILILNEKIKNFVNKTFAEDFSEIDNYTKIILDESLSIVKNDIYNIEEADLDKKSKILNEIYTIMDEAIFKKMIKIKEIKIPNLKDQIINSINNYISKCSKEENTINIFLEKMTGLANSLNDIFIDSFNIFTSHLEKLSLNKSIDSKSLDHCIDLIMESFINPNNLIEFDKSFYEKNLNEINTINLKFGDIISLFQKSNELKDKLEEISNELSILTKGKKNAYLPKEFSDIKAKFNQINQNTIKPQDIKKGYLKLKSHNIRTYIEKLKDYIEELNANKKNQESLYKNLKDIQEKFENRIKHLFSLCEKIISTIGQSVNFEKTNLVRFNPQLSENKKKFEEALNKLPEFGNIYLSISIQLVNLKNSIVQEIKKIADKSTNTLIEFIERGESEVIDEEDKKFNEIIELIVSFRKIFKSIKISI